MESGTIRVVMNETDHQAAVAVYLVDLKRLYYGGYATEVSYRGILESLIESFLPEIDAINEPKRVEVGAPDFVLTRRQADQRQLELVRNVPLGFIEAKDLKPGILDRPENRVQLERYMDLGNVIHTDGLTFRFYFERKLIKEISLGYINEQGDITTKTDDVGDLDFYLRQTVETARRTIRTAKMLALHMADRARPIRHTIQQALEQDLKKGDDTELTRQYDAFKETLIHDLGAQDFADIYAETIAYGLFAARYNDETPNDFNLVEAAQKVPQTNPFLRQFFLQIAAYEKDVRLDWVLNNFADLFRYADVHKIMSTYGKDTGMNHDPVTHFYETFLGEYDQKRRKARGVYYTPRPVVQYIVRAVDKVLKEEFGLADGLADDNSVTKTISVAPYKVGKAKDAKTYHTKDVEIPRVQVLDPATGTSTFLNETIKLIANKKAANLGSGWNDYVEKNLLPRIHGFEILMAAYSMAHMRLGLTLAESGYKPSLHAPRLGVYLTNALEEPAEDEPPLLAMMGMGRVLTEEAVAADKVKRDLPIMVVMGNPPYSVSSSNKSKHIDKIMADYKKDLNERNIQPLSDDYIKFIRYAESMIEKNGQGIVAMITNNSYIDGLIHRQMRKHLLQTFDKIWVLDLHGNAKKKEVAPDGSKDENVFDIMQGVSVVVMAKTGSKQTDGLAEVKFAEHYGRRADKYAVLEGEIEFEPLLAQGPHYFFVKKDAALQEEYDEFISIRELMSIGDVGVGTYRDDFSIDIDKNALKERVSDFYNLSSEEVVRKYSVKETASFSIEERRKGSHYDEENIKQIQYRPFDTRWIYYSSDVADRLRPKTSAHMLKPNLALSVLRNARDGIEDKVFVVDMLADKSVTSSLDNAVIFPLYLYQPDGARTENYNRSQLENLLSRLEQYYFVTDEKDFHKVGSYLITALDVLDYIYGVLHSPDYRAKYKELLKIDFPRVPRPENIEQFERYRDSGKKLRELHLMKGVTPGNYPLKGEGSGEIKKITFADGGVWINNTQYFDAVPEKVWGFSIGGYQPAQKWLKDRKGRKLGYKDIEHYQRMIAILVETSKIMDAVDNG